MRPQAGLKLGGRYRLDRRLAIGGMGEVWVCTDATTGRDVAVKVLREELTGQEDTLARLRAEARNAATLRHKNIAAVLDYGEEQGTGFLVMELVLGESMADLLEREPILPPKRLIPLLSQAARGLAHAHSLGVVHRDVKPGNILVERPGFGEIHPGAKITDFGVSRGADQASMTATGMVMGTAQYLAPEQAMGKAVDGLTDVYALGVIAYEATAGKRPFGGNSIMEIAEAHVSNPVPDLPPSTHPALAELIMRMLEKDPKHRPESASALADELDALAEIISSDPLGASWRQSQRAAELERLAKAPAGVYSAPSAPGTSNAPAPPPLPVGATPVRVSASPGRRAGGSATAFPATPEQGIARRSRLRTAVPPAPPTSPAMPTTPARGAAPAPPRRQTTKPPGNPGQTNGSANGTTGRQVGSAAPAAPSNPLARDVARLRPASPAAAIRSGSPGSNPPVPPPPPPSPQRASHSHDRVRGRILTVVAVAVALLALLIVLVVVQRADSNTADARPAAVVAYRHDLPPGSHIDLTRLPGGMIDASAGQIEGRIT